MEAARELLAREVEFVRRAMNHGELAGERGGACKEVSLLDKNFML